MIGDRTLRRGAPHIRGVTAALLIGAALAGCSEFEEAGMPPVDFAGSIGNTFSTRQFSDEPRALTNQVTATVNARTYVWQPWFAVVDGSLNTAYEKQLGGVSEFDSTSILTSGGLSLGVLPLSNYATTLAYNRADSRIEADFIGADFTRDSASVVSRAIFDTDFRGTLNLTHDNIDQPAFGHEARETAQISLSKNFTSDALTLGLDYSQADFVSNTTREDDLFDRTGIATLRYDSAPFEDVSIQSTTILLSEDEAVVEDRRRRNSIQGISTAQWRPVDRPFMVNAAWRTLAENVDVDGTADRFGSGDSNTELVSGTIGLNYPIMTGLTANAGLLANYQNITRAPGGGIGEVPGNAGRSARAGVLGNLAYLAPPEEIAGFTWRWNGNAGTEVAYDTVETVDETQSIGVGHSASRSLELPWIGPIRLGLEQNLATSHNSDEGAVVALGHQLSLSHSSASESSSTFVRFAVSDNRDVIGSDRTEFQLAQLQISRQSSVDLRSDWRADLTVQVARQHFAFQPSNTVFSANGTLGYAERQLFGVERLQFTSDLVLNSIGFESVVDASRNDRGRGRPRSEFFRSDWRNRIEYLIGRLSAGTDAVLFQENGTFGSLFLLRVRRSFGGGRTF